ncbi:exodeoxyribonuclease V subunit gamma [Waddlia chondrophila]|uniref:RecBCD enzyme subunit RecC n=1 Tax=Waddlia chondrophila (strain ATCC VR-1470 / WSU 86-1044) TaxID=716544 RepID=D6YTE8_WADCW|nr:exodeoxyribonuclease V subunit gamma [Waddlia chondrophila]ADI37409.1 exodeoxyribonuclease V gamma chain [Waddlia chondrophila WSU 86-1044]
MSPSIQVLLSNQTEILYQRLKEQLFTSDTDPFTIRVVVVPSKVMKNWLSLKLAEDLGVAAGIECLFLEPAMQRLQKLLEDPEENAFQLPSRVVLALSIEREIRQALKSEKSEIWKPLKDHLLDKRRKNLTGKGEKRLVSLSDQLAVLFAQYEKYGRKMLQRWQKGEPAGWQELLWKRIVGKVGPESFFWKKGNITVHLFALSYISRQQHQMLCSLSSHVPVCYYLLSPCEVFWSDLLSDKENSRLIRCWENQGMSAEALSEATELLFERNPLLANWGKLGRLMAAQIEETTLQTDENYRELDQESTCLQALQMDLLKLRNGKFLEKRSFKEDNSIQIHVSTSKTREVQALYQTLLGIIDQHREIDPYDIVVMAPNIKVYEPMIRAVFQSPQSQLNCQIMDLNLLDQSDVVKGFFHLLDLAETRWENESILNLFSFFSFQEKQGLTQTEVEKIGKWVRDTKIRWGIDARHRSEILLRNHCEKGMLDNSAAGTWKMGIDRLLLGTAMILPSGIEEKARFNRRPLREVAASDQELLGEWAFLIGKLREDLSLLSSGKKMPLDEWSEYLLYLLNQYFSWNRASEKEKAQAETLAKSIELLRIADAGAKDFYPFSTVIFHLKKALELQEVHDRENYVQAVRFCSMLPMRAVPAKVVVMMGMSEENYPRKEDKTILNQLYFQKGVDPFPSTTEFDRYLFLEAVLSARQSLILSYHKKEQGGEKLNECSLLISELVHYLDQSFSISGLKPSESIVYEHPFYSFDKKYFQEGQKIRSYSMPDYLAALSYYKVENKSSYRFLPAFHSPSSLTNQKFEVIDVKEIKRLARNPFRFYFQKRLGIFLKEEEETSTEETLTLSPLDLSKFRKESWRISMDKMLQIAELEGMIPVGPFRDLSIRKAAAEAASVAENMTQLSLKPSDLFEIQFCETCSTPRKEENRWVLPPLIVELESGFVRLEGFLGEGSLEGMIAYKKGEKRDIVELWPLYLIWCRAIEEHALPFRKDLLFIRSGERKESWLESSLESLKDYISYFNQASHVVSPLIPEWVEALTKEKASELEKALNLSLNGDFFYNDEVKWICRGGNALDSEEMHAAWSEQAKRLFSQPIAQWSGKKR